jgi:hypothetical protein
MGRTYSTIGGRRMHIGHWWESQKGKRQLGRPRRKWADNTKMGLREIGWGAMGWTDLA